MSENPFKIIRSTDEPPETLRQEVVGSVKVMMLLMRVTQLFIPDYAMAMFDNLRLVGPDGERKKKDGRDERT